MTSNPSGNGPSAPEAGSVSNGHTVPAASLEGKIDEGRSQPVVRASEIRYRRLFEAARDGILLLDPDTRKITDANPFMTELLSYPHEELLGKELWEIGLLKDEEASQSAFRELQQNQFVRYENLPLKSKTGKCREVEFVSNVYEEDGREVVQCNIRDISERKAVEDEMKVSEARHRSTLDSMLEGCQIIGKDWRYLYLNKAAATQNRRPNDELLGRKMTEVWPGMKACAIFALLQQGMTERIALHREEEFVYPDGSKAWFDVRCQPVPEGIFVLSIDITERKQKSEALRLRERALGEVSQGVLISDENRLAIYINAGFTGMTGYEEKDMLGRSCAILQGQGTNPATVTRMRTALDAALPFEGEILNYHKDGTPFWNELSIAPIRGEHGEPVRFIGIQRDITARKEAEKSLREKNARTRIAGRITHTGGWAIEIPSRALFWADELFHILEFPLGNTPTLEEGLTLYAEEWRDIFTTALETCISKGTAFDLEVEIFTAKKRKIWVRVCGEAERRADGSVARVQGAFQDITDRKTAFDQLLRRTAFFEAQANSALDGIMVVDGEGRKVLQNHRMVELWQIPRPFAEDTDDRRQFAWVTGQCKSPQHFVEKVAWLSTHPDEISRDEIELVNGKILDRYSAPARGKDGAYYGRIWTFRDVTAERLREAGLAKVLAREQGLVREAQAGSLVKSEFLAAMSHEIRTPMNSILGFSELLAQTPDLPAGCRDYVQTITSSGEALLRILNDILDYSRLEANGLKIEKAGFFPREVLQDIHTLLAPNAREKGLAYHLSVDEKAPPRLLNDAGRLRQVLLNLASNAIKFTEKGSVVLGLRASIETAKGQPVSLVFSVRDSGPGIPANKLNEIFSPFKQLDSSISRRYGGSGLGLSISQNLVKLMGGTLTVESQPGIGSEFRVTLPVTAPDESAAALATAPEDVLDETFAVRHPLRLMLVEDDLVNSKLMLIMLRKLGYVTLVARDGIEAVETYRRDHPDCILMDLQMPRKNGFEATTEIREIERSTAPGPQVFISALTANIVAEDQQRCFDLGMDAFLNKPIKRTLLAKVLAQAAAHGSTHPIA